MKLKQNLLIYKKTNIKFNNFYHELKQNIKEKKNITLLRTYRKEKIYSGINTKIKYLLEIKNIIKSIFTIIFIMN